MQCLHDRLRLNSTVLIKKRNLYMQKALDAQGYTTSPAQRMLNRRTRTLLPMSNRLLKPEIPTGVYKSQKANQAEQAFYYDKTAKDLKPLSDGDVVRVKPQDTDKKFIKAKVEKQVDIRSYRVKTEVGRVFRRNRKDLHKTPEHYNTYDNTLPDAPVIQQKQPLLLLLMKLLLNSYFIMLRVSLRNLLVRDAFKVVPLELAMSSFWFVFSGGSSLSVPRLVTFYWDPKSNGETKRVYLLVINESVKVVVRYIIYASK